MAGFSIHYPHSHWKYIIRRLRGGRLHRWITIFGGSASSVILIVFLYASDIITDLKLKTGEKSDSFTIDKRGAF